MLKIPRSNVYYHDIKAQIDAYKSLSVSSSFNRMGGSSDIRIQISADMSRMG